MLLARQQKALKATSNKVAKVINWTMATCCKIKLLQPHLSGHAYPTRASKRLTHTIRVVIRPITSMAHPHAITIQKQQNKGKRENERERVNM